MRTTKPDETSEDEFWDALREAHLARRTSPETGLMVKAVNRAEAELNDKKLSASTAAQLVLDIVTGEIRRR